MQASYRKADSTNTFAFHWSPTGGHGGPESFYRMEAWLRGHYPGITKTAPVADLQVSSQSGLTVNFSARASVANDTVLMPAEPAGDGALIAYDYDFGDGNIRNWGDVVTYSYADAGTYTAKVTVTDGEGLRSTAQVGVTVGGTAQVSLVVAAPSPLIIDEGQSVAVRVSLTQAPASAVTVNVARPTGDVDLTAMPASFVFSTTNWNVPRTVTLSAAQDVDFASSTAQFAFSGTGLATVTLDAQENDDDARFTVRVASATVAPGDSVPIAITLENPDLARVRSLSVTLGYDAAALGDPVMVKGAAVPGPASWNFGTSTPSAGMQVLARAQIAQPEGAVIDGVIATDTLMIPAATAPGRYDLTVTATAIDGRPAAMSVAGSITVATASGGGAGGGGGGLARASPASPRGLSCYLGESSRRRCLAVPGVD